MKDVLARIFALWAMIVFIVTMIPVVIIMWIIGLVNEPKRTRIFRITSKIWMQVFFFLSGCRLKVIGKEHFAKGQIYIVISNHNSLMDVPLTTPFIPGPNKTIAKVEMSKIPVFGLIYKRGSILVDRLNKNSRQQSFKLMKDVLKMEMHVCIYPEGTRNKTELPLKAFHDGAFRLAVETGTPIIPTLLFNTKKVLPPGKVFFFWPSKMELHFLSPVLINTKDNYEAIKEKIYLLMTEYYAGNQ
ncbi:MAG: 1-acyl-sn-glycerol-3-phosphate acyltransferase [Bacteroidota bacterium]|nr:1-acyl-sn-glycerol-3-phosphate acyltransferase [Bacteroidota bacterium]